MHDQIPESEVIGASRAAFVIAWAFFIIGMGAFFYGVFHN
jgi:hypothetical protein